MQEKIIRSGTAIFRCDASPEIGGGHVVRCMTLASELRRRGWICRFATLPVSLYTVPLLREEGFEVFSPEMLGDEADLLIVDHYALDREFETGARKWARRILVLDDLANRPHDCDLLLDQTYGRQAADYKRLTPRNCEILAGTRYALLRPQFAALRSETLKRRSRLNGQISRLLIMLGAGDKDNVTGLVLRGLEQLKNRYQIDVILGAASPHIDAIQEMAHNSHHEIDILINVADVASVMARTDLAIGAGGTGSWERCCMGLPTLVIEIADNQQGIIAGLQMAGAIINAGRFQEIKTSDIAKIVESLAADPALCRTMSEASAPLCDGRGVERLVDKIERMKEALA